jgi:phospholipase/carboxylesterase/glyoxalase family protein
MSAPGEPSGFIHRFIAAKEPDSPLTLLLLHGTGGDETDLLGVGRQLAPSAALLSPRGKVLEHGMPRYFRRLAEGLFDLEDLRARTHELADFVETAAQRYRLASDRIFAVGFSNGANIAASVLLLRPEALAGAVLFRAMVPLVPETMPYLRGRPVFLAAGRRDPIVSPDETERLRRLLSQAGADVTLHWETAGHELTPADIEAARAWLKEWATARRDRAPGHGAKERQI